MLSDEVPSMTSFDVGGKTHKVREKGRASATRQPSAVGSHAVDRADDLHAGARRRNDQHFRLGHLAALEELRPHVGLREVEADDDVEIGSSTPAPARQQCDCPAGSSTELGNIMAARPRE